MSVATYPPACLANFPVFGVETANWHHGDWNSQSPTSHEGLTPHQESKNWNKFKIITILPGVSTVVAACRLLLGCCCTCRTDSLNLTEKNMSIRLCIALFPIVGNIILLIADIIANCRSLPDNQRRRDFNRFTPWATL